MTNAIDSEKYQKGWRSNRGIAVVLSAFLSCALAYYLSQDWVFERLRDKFLLGLPTVFSVFWMLTCALSIIFDRFRHDVCEGVATFELKFFLWALSIVGSAYLFFAAAQFIGLPLSILLFSAGGMYVLGLRPIKTCFIAAFILTLAIAAVFFVIGQRWEIFPMLNLI